MAEKSYSCNCKVSITFIFVINKKIFRYIQSFFAFLNLCYGSIALAHTVIVLDQNNFSDLSKYFTFFLLFAVYEGKFSPIIAVIDFSKRTLKPLQFGEDWRSTILIGAVVGITVLISISVSYSAIWFESNDIV